MSGPELLMLSIGVEETEQRAERQPPNIGSRIVAKATPNPYFQALSEDVGFTKRLPPWLDHFDTKSLKRLLKCFIAVWVQTILIFINPTLHVLGEAAFVGW